MEMAQPKSFEISKQLVWQAYKLVKANKGGCGVDDQSLDEFDKALGNNLYRIWNRMSSGSYFPPPVKAVTIAKKDGGERILGIPTVADRIAQAVVKQVLEPELEPYFHEDSYGYRPGKSAHQAIEITRQRCWWHDWVLEFDIRGLFDNIDHGLLMKAVRHHTDCKWVVMYVERWLTASMLKEDGSQVVRDRGTPQGGVISPLLANLFLHYAFDLWMVRQFPKLPFCRYADDGLIHCRSERQARYLLARLKSRFEECGLEIHPKKTRVVYCRDMHRRQKYEHIQFDFLGYTFRPRRSKDRFGRVFANFTPGISRQSAKAIRQEVRRWRVQLKSEKSIKDLGCMFGPVIRGWVNYFCRFHRSAYAPVARHLNLSLARWVMRKYKRFRGHKVRAIMWLRRLARRQPSLFPHWQAGFVP